jgi:L,D-transpeptidase YcbB
LGSIGRVKLKVAPTKSPWEKLLIAAAAVALLFGGEPTQALSESTSTPGVSASPTPSNTDESVLRALIATGTLADLRRPDFADRQADIDKFYASGQYSPVWLNNGEPTLQARSMIESFKQASLKGLDSEDYDSSRWDARLAMFQTGAQQPAQSAMLQFDLALTICAMRYLSDLHDGRANPQPRKFSVTVGNDDYDLSKYLRDSVINAPQVAVAIDQVEPPYAGYRRAEVALAGYIQLAAAGDGAPLPVPQKGVRPGQTYTGMAQLARRLQQLGDMAPNANPCPNPSVYCDVIVQAVRQFQRRHGLESDGILGKDTVARMNQPFSLRVLQLDLALERYRWIPPKFPNPPLVVNIPEFELRSMRRQPAYFLSMRVVVGKAYGRQTPVFAQDMRYLVFRPYWNVPFSIVRNEIIAKIERDPGYFVANNFEVVDKSGNVITDNNVSEEQLSQLRSGALQVRQKPGPTNSLGLVKFIFPNSYNVYMHGTPATELFARARRDFSHGCIRVEDPVALAAWVLRDQPEWNLDRIRATMNGDQTVQVNLPKPIPVLILYTTAVVEPDGEVSFFDDIYGEDASLAKTLAIDYPANPPVAIPAATKD